MTGYNVNTLNQYPGFVGENFKDLTWFLGVLIVTRDNHYGIALFDVEFGFESIAHLLYFKALFTQFIRN
jgi:hypothetical protein